MLYQGSVKVKTDKGKLFICAPNSILSSDGYLLENDFVVLKVKVFNKGKHTFYRSIIVKCKCDLTIYEIQFILTAPKDKTDFIFYKSFINAPACAFVRCDKTGLYTGAENPYSILFVAFYIIVHYIKKADAQKSLPNP